MRPWLLDRHSLTARLLARDGGPLEVQRQSQGWERPLASERRLLGLAQRQVTLVREVVLRLSGRPVVFARSVLPRAALGGRLGFLRHLRNRPLGAILFAHPDLRRSPFEVARLPGDSDYLPPFLRGDAPVWGRRSCFVLQGQAMLVSEVFLAAAWGDRSLPKAG